MIDDIIGKPFKLRGRGPNEFDCLGVALYLYRVLYGIELPDPFAESVAAGVDTLRGQLLEIRNISLLTAGDLLFIQGLRGISDQHVAFAEDGKWLVTAAAGKGVYRAAHNAFDRTSKVQLIYRPKELVR